MQFAYNWQGLYSFGGRCENSLGHICCGEIFFSKRFQTSFDSNSGVN